jgi:hypothetical protein
MSNPQQPELARSRKTPAQDQDAVAGVIEGQRQPTTEGPSGPMPADNQPGHHPAEEQDKPDLNAFAAKLGVVEAPAEEGAAGDEQASPSGRSIPTAAVAAGIGALLVLLLAVLAGRRRRNRS